MKINIMYELIFEDRVAPITTRKDDHLKINLQENVQSALTTGLERYQFIHEALPELNLAKVDTSLSLFGKALRAPILISSMTGGTAEAATINLNLAEAVQELGVAMGLGSQRAALERPELSETFQVRRIAPDILLFANLGAVQLNYGFGIDECRQAVEMVEADALVLHLNPVQEALQQEGNTNFEGLARKIELIAIRLDVPIIAKEVGCGHYAAADVVVNPGNEKEPVTIKNLDRVSINPAGVDGKQYATHDARIDSNDANTMFWSTYVPDANKKMHVGKSDLRTGKVIQDAALTPDPKAPAEKAPTYCASGQSKNFYMPVFMGMEGYVDVFDKKDMSLKHRVWVSDLGYAKGTYKFTHGITSPDFKTFLIALNQAKEGNGRYRLHPGRYGSAGAGQVQGIACRCRCPGACPGWGRGSPRRSAAGAGS